MIFALTSCLATKIIRMSALAAIWFGKLDSVTFEKNDASLLNAALHIDRK
ncbi:hypothetical protein KR51_00009860 [Rubidibacter lacunae KORDI 51-2]|uniref:Uncharacterized protein n=1 Tax=Rubidibacter lacunae KORDI 51-2 TaxID=582515 RepID=U5DCT5_9CHRO|nr:hypothetical protein KR51_00009860 [Rubidibacter lacunae KORDI 51-2]